jgi:peptidoglycan/LPS O-acetylase OafA/YrhL
MAVISREIAGDKARADFHIPSLDGIRGVAALIVFGSHCGLENVIPGGLGVTVFFVLSGFLITVLLTAEFEKSATISLRRFYLRRIYRILPPMYIVLGLLLTPFVLGRTHAQLTTGGLIAQFAQLTNYYVILHGVHSIVPATAGMWSLSVEEHFYLLYPIGLWFALSRWNYRRIAAGLAGICALVLAWRCAAVLLGFSDGYTYTATECRIDSLLYGCILALAANPTDRSALLSERRAPWILIAALLVLVFTLIERNAFFRETFRYSLQGLALMPLFYCAVKFHDWICFRWLSAKPLVWMGLISYTFYLVHVKALAIVSRYIENDAWLANAGGFVVAIVFSTLMYVLVEKHLAALRRRLHRA